jgi:8-oxo-dGTP pyrophosphatase MutT (NUDIX family)
MVECPLSGQYRPALESFTWELPAGLVDHGEEPAICCRRELLEETGFAARAVYPLGSYAPCTSRLSNRVHSFYVETGPTPERETVEAGLELMFVNPPQLAKLITDGEFVLQLHIGALLLAGMHGFTDLSAITTCGKAG